MLLALAKSENGIILAESVSNIGCRMMLDKKAMAEEDISPYTPITTNIPHVEEEILAPMDLIQRYQEERSSLNAEIDVVLAEITERLGGAK